VTFRLCNITAKLPSEGICSWPPENRSLARKGGRGPRLRNPVLVEETKLPDKIIVSRFRSIQKRFFEL